MKIDPALLNSAMKQRIQDALEAGALLVESTAKQLCPVDIGDLRSSIHVKIKSWNEVRVIASKNYAAAVEHGSVPHGAPFEPIAGWAKRHGIANWGGVWWKIYHFGTPPQPFMAPAIEAHKDDVLRLVTTASQDAIRSAKTF